MQTRRGAELRFSDVLLGQIFGLKGGVIRHIEWDPISETARIWIYQYPESNTVSMKLHTENSCSEFNEVFPQIAEGAVAPIITPLWKHTGKVTDVE